MSNRLATALAVLLVVAVVAYILACSQATWSPDGRSIAFVSRVGGEPPAFRLYVAEASGAAEPRLLWESPSFLSAPGWSADSRTLAVVNIAPLSEAEQKDAKEADFAKVKDGKDPLADRLYLVSVADGKRRLLAEQKFLGEGKMATEETAYIEPWPQYASGGKLIIWSLQPLEEVRLVDVESGKVTKRLENAAAPIMAPSGKAIAFLEKGEGDFASLALFDLQKEERRAVVKSPAADRQFALGAVSSWSPDSSKLAVVGHWMVKKTKPAEEGQTAQQEWTEEGKVTPWIIALSDGSPQPLVKDLKDEVLWVAWSPKGDLLAFPAEIKGGKLGIWTVKPDGSDLKRIAGGADKGTLYHPTFSPDGSKLSYRLVGDNEKMVYTVVHDLKTGAETVLPKPPPPPTDEKPAEKQAEKPVEGAPQK